MFTETYILKKNNNNNNLLTRFTLRQNSFFNERLQKEVREWLPSDLMVGVIRTNRGHAQSDQTLNYGENYRSIALSLFFLFLVMPFILEHAKHLDLSFYLK